MSRTRRHRRVKRPVSSSTIIVKGGLKKRLQSTGVFGALHKSHTFYCVKSALQTLLQAKEKEYANAQAEIHGESVLSL